MRAQWCISAVMDRWRRWRSRSLTSRADARRAGVTALALFVVTAALAVLLAVLFHLAWPPVLVSVVGTVPALYLAWLAVPGAISQKKSAYGRRVAQWTPVELGVHRVIDAGPMPTYVRRPHDELLRAVLDPAVPASRLVVVRGGSSTGKTRAAYEAVAERLAGWRLDYPLNAAVLKERLDAGIPARTVLWLGELRQYADADGGAEMLGRLADLIAGEGRLLITTVWPEQWSAYTAAARPGLTTEVADPAGTAGRLLEPLPELTGRDPAAIDPVRGGVIDIPPRFTAADLEAVARTGDPVLAKTAAAAASAGQDGQVTQYLAGVPDLLDRYEGSGGDPYGQAVITAAMDAVRLGHASPLSAALIQEAAVGYLTGPQRTTSIESWRDTALAWAAEELKGAVRALQPVPPPSGTGVAGYQVADYLDQYGRRTRQDQLGPPSLWDALAARTASASDLTRLGQAAQDRGLYRHAAALWTTAATMGSTEAARQLITHLHQVSPGDTTRAAQWAAGHASLDDPGGVAELLRVLRVAGASDAVTTLLARDPAGHASLDNPGGVATLLSVLRVVGAGDAVTALAARAVGHASLDNPGDLAALLRMLRVAGANDEVTALAARAAGHASLDNPGNVAALLSALREAGASDEVTALAARAAGHASLDNPGNVAELLSVLREAGASDAVTALAARAAGHASLDNPGNVAELLSVCAGRASTTAGRAAGHASLDDPGGVAELLRVLRVAGASTRSRPCWPATPATPASTTRGASPRCCGCCAWPGPATRSRPCWPATPPATPASTTRGASPRCCRRWAWPGPATRSPTLLARDPAGHASLDNPGGVAALLRVLRVAGASDAVTTLLARDPAGHASLDNPGGVAALLSALGVAGASDAVTALAARAAGHASLDNPGDLAALLRMLRVAGANDEVTALLARDPAGHASLDNPGGVPALLSALREAGASDAVTTLAARAANAGMFGLFLAVLPDEASSYLSGREPDGAPSQSWKWQEP